MHNNAAFRKSGQRSAYEANVGSPFPHKHKGKNEAGSPNQGEALISKKLDSVELLARKLDNKILLSENIAYVNNIPQASGIDII